jgi:RHS repeat-associated protein
MKVEDKTLFLKPILGKSASKASQKPAFSSNTLRITNNTAQEGFKRNVTLAAKKYTFSFFMDKGLEDLNDKEYFSVDIINSSNAIVYTYTTKVNATGYYNFDYSATTAGTYTWRFRRVSLNGRSTSGTAYFDDFKVSSTIQQSQQVCSSPKNYRFGFNGKEDDREVDGQQDYGMRIYDSRLGRFKSVDPLTHIYSFLTPYQFASNSPIGGIDIDGLELLPINSAYYQMRYYGKAPVLGSSSYKDMYGVFVNQNNLPANYDHSWLRSYFEVGTNGKDGVVNYSVAYRIENNGGKKATPPNYGCVGTSRSSTLYMNDAAEPLKISVPIGGISRNNTNKLALGKQISYKTNVNVSDPYSSIAAAPDLFKMFGQNFSLLKEQIQGNLDKMQQEETKQREAFYKATNITDSYFKQSSINNPVLRADVINYILDGTLIGSKSSLMQITHIGNTIMNNNNIPIRNGKDKKEKKEEKLDNILLNPRF